MVEAARNLGLYIDNVQVPFTQCNQIWSDVPEERDHLFQEYEKGIWFCSTHQIPTLVIHISRGATPPAVNQSGSGLAAPSGSPG